MLLWSNWDTMGSVLHAGSQHQTFRHGATWWLTHSGAQCTTSDTTPTSSFTPSIRMISSSVPARDAQPGKHHGTRWIPPVHEASALRSAAVWLVLAWHVDIVHDNGIVRCARVDFEMDMDDAPSAKDADHFRHVASSREVLIENTLKCSRLNYRISRGTPQIRCASSFCSLRIWSRLLWCAACISGWWHAGCLGGTGSHRCEWCICTGWIRQNLLIILTVLSDPEKCIKTYKVVIAVNGSEDKFSLPIVCSDGMRLKKPLTNKSISQPSSGGTVSTDGRRGEGGPLASQNQMPQAGGAHQSWPIAHVGEGKVRSKTSSTLRLDPLMGRAGGVKPWGKFRRRSR